MTENRDTDPEIARLFEAQRVSDEVAAPDLDALLARPARRRASEVRAIRRFTIGAAALAAVAAAVILLRPSPPGRPSVSDASGLPNAALELAGWKAPTDAFLQTPGSDLWTEVPDLAPAAPQLETGVLLETTKGVER